MSALVEARNALAVAGEMVQAVGRWSASLQAPTLLLEVWGGLLAAALLALLVARARRRPAAQDRWAAARQLAARGASTLEIARATGLARDAAALLLRAGNGAAERMILPAPARISAPQRALAPFPFRRRGA